MLGHVFTVTDFVVIFDIFTLWQSIVTVQMSIQHKLRKFQNYDIILMMQRIEHIAVSLFHQTSSQDRYPSINHE